MVVKIFKSACLNRAMTTSSLVGDFKSYEDQRMIADWYITVTKLGYDQQTRTSFIFSSLNSIQRAWGLTKLQIQ